MYDLLQTLNINKSRFFFTKIKIPPHPSHPRINAGASAQLDAVQLAPCTVP